MLPYQVDIIEWIRTDNGNKCEILSDFITGGRVFYYLDHARFEQ